MSDKCPFCGEKDDYQNKNSHWDCGTPKVFKSNTMYRYGACYERQISQLQEKLEAWRMFVKKADYNYDTGFFSMDVDWTKLDNLRKFGEILIMPIKLNYIGTAGGLLLLYWFNSNFDILNRNILIFKSQNIINYYNKSILSKWRH